MHANATISSTTVASTDAYEYIEGNVYFPPSSISEFAEILTPSARTTQCPWKGTAQYYDVTVDGNVVKDAAWSYNEPFEKAERIRDKSKVHVEKDNGTESKSHGSVMDKVKNVFKS